MADLKCLTTKEVARLCRVSDATVKRWHDAGLLESERTSGGHRRFRSEEVARFQREQKLGQKKCHGDETIVAASRERQTGRGKKCHSSDSIFFQSLIKGCEEAAANVLVSAYLRGKSPWAIFDDMICPAMFQIGELWASGQLTISQEHLASRVAQTAIYKLRSALVVSKNTENLAMCCAPESDLHELPTHLTQITIENEGWEAMNFGANTPLGDFTKEVLRHAPALICLSATVVDNTERFYQDYKTFRERIAKLKIPVVLGGGIFKDKRIRRHFSAELYARNFGEVARFVQTLEN